jgi:hypothetical protein
MPADARRKTLEQGHPEHGEAIGTAGLGLVVGIGVLVAVLVFLIVVYLTTRRRGIQMGARRIVRCSDGHLFTSTWIPGVSFKAIRLGSARYERCPVGNHWALARNLDPSTLSPEDRRLAEATLDTKIP